MGKPKLFDVVLLLARPGAGKSEVIHYLKELPDKERAKDLHMGKLHEIDDFPMLWTWFEEDAILQEFGLPRLHTDEDGYFQELHLWDLLIHRIGLDWRKAVRDGISAASGCTTLVEFSRGVQHGGFRRAFDHLEPNMLERAAILYINVSWEESLRKNRSRFNPDKPDSILEHGLPDTKLEFLYRDSDWHELAGESCGLLDIHGISVPYAVMENEDDVTTKGGQPLKERLDPVIKKLWNLYSV